MSWFTHNVTMLSGILACPEKAERTQLRYTQGGAAVCEFRLGVSEYDKASNQNKRWWISIVFWGKHAEWAADKLGKGMEVAIVGKLHDASYTNRDGQNVQKFVIWVDTCTPIPRSEGDSGSGNRYGGEPYSGDAGTERGRKQQKPAEDEYDIGDLGPPLDLDKDPGALG